MAEEALRGRPVTGSTSERLPRPRGPLRLLRREQRGTALVEFALVLLPLCLILFGIIDFARALNYYNDLNQIAGQGARAAAVNENPNGGVASSSFQSQLIGNLDSPEMKAHHTTPRTTVCVTTPSGTGEPVKVTASFVFHFIPLIHPVAITLTASQTERFEGSTPSYTGGCASP